MNTQKSKETPGDDTLELVLKGKLMNKVEIAATIRSAYRLLDRLCDGRYSQVRFVYREDFEIPAGLLQDFQNAAEQALAYKEALVFGRPIGTDIVGLLGIEHPPTRKMATRLHGKD